MKRLLTASLVGAVAGGALIASAQEAPSPTVLMIPPRHTIIKIGLDICALRPAVMITYQDPGGTEPVLHVWNPDPREWVRVSPDTYAAGSMFRSRPREVIVISGQEGVPEAVREASAALAPVREVNSLDLVSVINALNDSLKFDRGEWRWLADRYGLTLKDVNADRRRYGKYGPPGGSRGAGPVPPPEPAGEEIVPVPVEGGAAPDIAPEAGEPMEAEVAVEPAKGAAPAPEVAPEDK